MCRPPSGKKPDYLYLIACRLPLALVFASALPSFAGAAFESQPTSVRAASMGDAYMASANESAALFTNPAGIAKLASPELSMVYGKPLAGLSGVNLNQGHVSMAVPTRLGHFGLGFGVFQAASLLQESTLALSYGLTINKSLQLGVTGKHFRHSYSIEAGAAASDPVFQKGSSRSAFTVDLGLMMPVGRYLKFGAGVRNLNEPDVGLATEDNINREIQAGVLLNLADLGLKLSGDLMLRNAGPEDLQNSPRAFLGLEKLFYNNRLALRAGANPYEYAGGFGLRIGANARFDYGFLFSTVVGNASGSHRAGLTYRFKRNEK